MHADERAECKNWLSSFYDAGTAVKPKMLGKEVAKGFRTRTFANEGHGLFALLAFLTGSEDGAVFNLLDIFGAVKPALRSRLVCGRGEPARRLGT